MKKYQNSLLAGVAALALVAGTGFAMAQQSSEHGSMGSKGASPQAGQSMNHQSMGREGMQSQAQDKSKGTQTQAQDKGSSSTQNQAQERGNTKANETAQTGNKANAGPAGRQADENMGKRGTKSSARAEHMNRGSRNDRQNTAERQRTLKGLQGNAQNENQQGSSAGSKSTGSNQAQQQPQNNNRERGTENAQVNGGGTRGGSVQLSEQQRTQIRTTVINGHNAPRVGHVDFDVRVGTAIPRGRIHVVPVPETLVRIEPRWRGFLYFVYEDEVVIVNPRTYHIVAVVPA
jgi:hypothetical protein